MVRRHLFLVTLFILAIAALTVPESRRVLRMQMKSLAFGRAYPESLSVGIGCSNDFAIPAGAFDVSLAPEWETYIARAQLDSSREFEYCRKAIAAGPGHPETYAAAIMAHLRENFYLRPEVELLRNPNASPEDSQSNNLAPEAARALLELSRSGSDVDPENAFFNLMAAYALFGMHRDAEALDHVRSAAGKMHYDSYRQMALTAMVEYLEAAGLPRMDSYAAYYQIPQPHLADTRHVAYLTVWHARQLEAQGHPDRAEELLTDLLKIGGLMRRDSTIVVEHLVAIAVQSTIAYIEPAKPKQQTAALQDWEQEQRRRAERVGQVLRGRGWTDLAALWSRESESALEFDRRVRGDFSDSTGKLATQLSFILATSRIGSEGLRLAVALSVIAGLVWLVARAKRWQSRPTPPLGWPGKLGLAILALTPWAAFIGLASLFLLLQGDG